MRLMSQIQSIFYMVHGTTKVSCNMPLEDTLKLLNRINCERTLCQRNYIVCERIKRDQSVGIVIYRELQFLLRMLAADQWISRSEISILIRHLTEGWYKIQ